MPSSQHVRFSGTLAALLAVAVAAVACGPAASRESGGGAPAGAPPRTEVAIAKYADEWMDPAKAPEPPLTQAGGIPPEDLTATPKPGGRLTIMIGQAVSRLDPHFQLSYPSGWRHRVYGNGLLRWDPKTGTPQPDLAQSWTVAPDAMSYDFKIRQGVKFHTLPPVNGRALTIHDIKWSLDRVSGLEASPGKQGIFFERYRNVKEFQVSNDTTLRMVMKQPDVQILAEIMNDFHIVLPKEAMIDNSYEQDKTLIGTGPFIVEFAEAGGQYRYRRNPDYWEKDTAGRQLPYLDAILALGAQDASATLAAFKTKQIDFAPLEYALAKNLLSDPNIRHYSGRGMVIGPIGVYMNTTIKPFNEVRVRRAVNLALDREEILDAVHRGPESAYLVSPLGGWAPWHWDENKMWSLPGYARGEAKQKEIAEAKRLLAEAGYPSGIPSMKFYGASGITFEVLQKQLAEVGIKVTLEPGGGQTIRYATFMKDKEIAYAGQGGGHTPDVALTVAFLCTAVQNMSNYCNPELDRLFSEERRERDTAKRMQLMDKIQQVLFDDMPMAPLTRGVTVKLSWKYVRGYRNDWYDVSVAQGHQTAYLWLDK